MISNAKHAGAMAHARPKKTSAFSAPSALKAFLLTVGVLFSGHSWAGQPDGAMMAHTCAACHGTFGQLENSAFVPLAGMKEQEFVRAMREFRDNERPSTLMHSVAVGFSDSEYQAMAAFFAAQPVKE